MTIPCKAIIFDCDGVIFDSNALKTAAFREVLAAYPQELVDEFIAYHQKTGGVSRYVKLRVFFTEFLKTSVDEEKLQKFLNDFGNSCQRLYQQADLTPGCVKVLETLSGHIPLYVASGSDEAELRQVFAGRDLDKYFKGIYGSPKTKQDCVAKIIDRLDFGKEIVFVGDAESDWKAARGANINFVFMAKFSDAANSMKQKALENNFTVIDTLSELLSLLDYTQLSISGNQ